MEQALEAQDALFALYAVKLDIASDSDIEKALSRLSRHPEASLQELIVEGADLDAEQVEEILDAVDPEVINGFRIDGEAGRGGMGVVYRALQLSMDRIVAVKVLSRALSGDSSYVAKFLTEARSAGKLNHENIVAAIDAGESNGLHYFVMEFVDGPSAADLLEAEETGKLSYQATFEIIEQVARGLEHAHQAGLVHRDVKPENIMIASSGIAKLCDLGLAKKAQVAGTGEKAAMTEGTPYYCSPEQALGRTDIDPKSDIYSLGATTFHLLTGKPPFDGKDARSILRKQVREPFPKLDKVLKEVPAPYRRLLEAMVIKERKDRLPTMREFLERLKAARQEVHGKGKKEKKKEREKSGMGLVPAGPPGKLQLALGLAGVFLLFAIIGASVGLAVHGSGPDGSLITPGNGDDPNSGQAGDDDDDPGGGPGVKRIPREDDPSGGDASEADKLLEAAKAAAKKYASEPWKAQERFLAIAERYDGTRVGKQAADSARDLQEKVDAIGNQGFDALLEKVLAEIEAGRYKVALTAADSFLEEWGSRGVSKLDGRVRRLKDTVSKGAKAALLSALDDFQKAEDEEAKEAARVGVEALLDQVPDELAADARARLTQGDQREALELWRKAKTEARMALRKGDRKGAERILVAARDDERLKALASDVEADLRIVQGLNQAWETFDQRMSELTRKPRVTLRLSGGQQLRGKLTRYDKKAWICEGMFEDGSGGTEARKVDLRTLATRQLLEMVLPPEEGLYNVNFFLWRLAPGPALAALDAYVAAGGKDDPALRKRITQQLGGLEEKKAELLIATIASPKTSAEEVVRLAKTFPKNLRSTNTFRARFEMVKAAYARARVAEIATDVEKMFAGGYSTDRKGRVTLSYDFKTPDQAKDWATDKTVDKASRLEVKDGTLVARGKVTHVARFRSGELKVEFRGTTRNPARPNLNVVLASKRGWRGVLCAGGLYYSKLKEVKVDATAPKKAGYVVDLPANVVVFLAGRRLRKPVKKVMAAEEQPNLNKAGASVKFVVHRNDKGILKFKIKSRTITSLPLPGDQSGAVAFLPLGSEIEIREMQITGRLDTAWLAERALQLAKAEAASLPGPVK